MKRSPASTSCLQQPRGGCGGSNDSENDHGPPQPPSLLLAGRAGGGSRSHPNLKPAAMSVTILNAETLPTYSCERFYMLSEIEMHAPPVVFLSQLEEERLGEDDAATVDTETDERTISSSATTFPPCLILYLLWRPTAEQDAETFVAQTLQTQLKRLQQYVDICSFEEVASHILRSSSSSSPSNRNSMTTTTSKSSVKVVDEIHATAQGETKSQEPQEEAQEEEKHANSSNGNNNDNQKPKCSVYIVVDRLSPDSTTPTEGETAASSSSTTDPVAEQLARAVATHETLRAIVQGITVGVSNHVRAAPGLEACADAVSLGARDRRQAVVLTSAGPTVANSFSRNINTTTASNSNNNKSFLGIVADSPDDLLGLADPNECDAAQGVRQLKISAEYNGRGNLQSFATRSHTVWRQRHGLPPPVKTAGSRRVPRRIRRSNSSSNNGSTTSSFAASARSSREMEFLIYDSIAILLLILYVTFHSGHLLFPRRQEE